MVGSQNQIVFFEYTYNYYYYLIIIISMHSEFSVGRHKYPDNEGTHEIELNHYF